MWFKALSCTVIDRYSDIRIDVRNISAFHCAESLHLVTCRCRARECIPVWTCHSLYNAGRAGVREEKQSLEGRQLRQSVENSNAKHVKL